MSLLRRTASVIAAAAIALTGLAAQPAHAADADVYTTPGGHIVNDRLWDTQCSMYSSNVVRCTTNIWGTQIRYEKGRFVNKTGWQFNNITYLASPRAAWKGNPLGDLSATDKGNFTSAGRNWRTACDTAVRASSPSTGWAP